MSNSKINSSRSAPKTNIAQSKSKINSSRTATGNSDDKSRSDDKSMRESTRSLNKSNRNFEVSPSKVKLTVKEIPEEDGDGSVKKKGKSKKE